MANPCTFLSTPESIAAALRYIHSRGAAHKLREPVPVIYADASHAAAIRQYRQAKAAPVSWRESLRTFNHNPV